jgi:prepilin-type N-terminal cleavage/methylation domain-containing protein
VRRPAGFTIVEIIVVLLLMSILAATLLGRSITTGTIDLNSATDKIRNQLRYAQSQAMKRTDAVWGIQSDGSSQYWLFRATPSTPTKPSATEEVLIPGGDYAAGGTRVSFANLGADLNIFTLVFDSLGRPYKGQTNGVPNSPVIKEDNPIVKVTKGEERQITITPETGFCVIQ